MKLSSFLGWRSRTLTAAFTARNHEEQSRTARGTRDHAHTLSDFLVPTLSIECQPCGRHGRYNVARLIEKYGDAKLPELRPGALWQRHPREHARDLERIICVDLAPNPAPSSLGDLDFSTCPARVFVPEGAGEAREPGPIRQGPRIASKLECRNDYLTISAC